VKRKNSKLRVEPGQWYECGKSLSPLPAESLRWLMQRCINTESSKLLARITLQVSLPQPTAADDSDDGGQNQDRSQSESR